MGNLVGKITPPKKTNAPHIGSNTSAMHSEDVPEGFGEKVQYNINIKTNRTGATRKQAEATASK
jgi:hypothetical protein